MITLADIVLYAGIFVLCSFLGGALASIFWDWWNK